MLDVNKTVREFAIESPSAIRVFEKLRIDYCCGGNQPLKDACVQKGLQVDDVLQLLGQATQTGTDSELTNSQSLPLANLITLIVEKHHAYTRKELEFLSELLERVCTAHGQNHPELLHIRAHFYNLHAELLPHMMKEENILFPFITRLEMSVTEDRPAPFAPFGQLRNPIAVMMSEHESAGEILEKIRTLSHDFTVPDDACFSYRTLYKTLEELELDLHQHIHLENNVLFPRASELEQKTRVATM
jgi:regulator of cell morphogenesis and NO signaling